MSIVITGATGLIGRALTKSYIQDRTPVTVFTRDAQRASQILPVGLDVRVWDPASHEPPPLPGHVETVFHMMGEPVSGRWTAEKKANIISSRVTAAEKLAAAVRGRPCRLISASSFGIYAGEYGKIYEETAPLPAPATEIQHILQAWERAVLAADSPPTRANVIRFGMVCAPDGYPKKLVRLFKRGLGFIAGRGDQIVPIVSIDDAVGMMRWAATGAAGDGPINCVSPTLPTFREVADIIAETLRTSVKFSVPQWLARPILGGSADYFLLSYHLRPRVALDRGYNFRMSDPPLILRRAILGHETEA